MLIPGTFYMPVWRIEAWVAPCRQALELTHKVRPCSRTEVTAIKRESGLQVSIDLLAGLK